MTETPALIDLSGVTKVFLTDEVESPGALAPGFFIENRLVGATRRRAGK